MGSISWMYGRYISCGWHIIYHISYHIISYHIISYHIISYHIISYHIWYDMIWYDMIWYDMIWPYNCPSKQYICHGCIKMNDEHCCLNTAFQMLTLQTTRSMTSWMYVIYILYSVDNGIYIMDVCGIYIIKDHPVRDRAHTSGMITLVMTSLIYTSQ